MNKLSNDPHFQLRKKIESMFQQKHPNLWLSIYSLISFNPKISYSRARKTSIRQEEIMNEIMKINNIEQCWQDDFIYEKLKELVQNSSK
jgi:kynurenine 3-monooxygenase